MNAPDVYLIDRTWSWPPGSRPKPPATPSSYEILRICKLQAMFRASQFPDRSGPRSRLGTAVHRALEEIWHLVPESLSLATSVFRRRGFEIFKACLEDERTKARNNPRESGLPWPESACRDAQISIGISAGRLLDQFRGVKGSFEGAAGAVTEELLTSRDGLLAGRPDLVLTRDGTPTVVDYKSGNLSDPDTIARFSRQTHLYAYLWHDVHGVWPTEARLVNPLAQVELVFPIAMGEASALAADAAKRLREVTDGGPAHEMASVGDHCAHCPFRPWCEPYWSATDSQHHHDGRRDIEGRVLSSDVLRNEFLGGVRALIKVQTGAGDSDIYATRGPDVLAEVQSGMDVRVLDATVNENTRILSLTLWSEIFMFK